MIKKILSSFILTIVVAIPVTLSSVYVSTASAAPCDPNKAILGIPTWYKHLDGEEDATGKCKLSIDTAEDALPIGLAVLEIGMTLAGLVAVVMIFIASFKYIISVGEPDKAAGARKSAINAVIGLIIVLISTRVVSFIGARIG